jgi:hypothetical protein
MASSAPQATGWWTCHRCGQLIPNGCTHSCQTSLLPQPSPPGLPLDPTAQQTAALHRLATAIERLAAALEEENGKAAPAAPA